MSLFVIVDMVYIFFPMGSAYPKNCAVVSLMTMAMNRLRNQVKMRGLL